MYLHKMFLNSRFRFLLSLGFLCFSLMSNLSYAATTPSSQLFPLNNYNQNIDHWIDPSDPSYTQSLVDTQYQKMRLKEFYNHTFESGKSGLSPWSQEYVTHLLNQSLELHNQQKGLVEHFSNDNKEAKKIGHGENFRPHTPSWINTISNNMNLEQFSASFHFTPKNRGILVQNTYARALPTLEPHFYHHELPGEGYPFDNLQMSSLWVGTPVYVVGQTRDKQWSFIISPAVHAWIPTETIARTNQKFVSRWQVAAKHKLAAILKTETTITDTYNKNYQLKAYVGSVFPMITRQQTRTLIMLPIKDLQGNAVIRRALLNNESISAMPLAATPENFVKLIKTLQNRPYGWGGLYFYNDCSSELKNLYTPFGIWLPRHSSDQTKSGKMVNKNDVTPKERIEYLTEKGRPFFTFIYNTKHVFMYLGNVNYVDKKNDNKLKLVPLTYQNIWGLKPLDASRRAIIGQSVIFPLLNQYPEDPSLNSPANNKDFQVIFLDEWPE